jgi:hypothetical protein
MPVATRGSTRRRHLLKTHSPSPPRSPHNDKKKGLKSEEAQAISGAEEATFTSPSQRGLTTAVKVQLLDDILKSGGFEFLKLAKLCDQKPDIYGDPGTHLRRKVQNTAFTWKHFDLKDLCTERDRIKESINSGKKLARRPLRLFSPASPAAVPQTNSSAKTPSTFKAGSPNKNLEKIAPKILSSVSPSPFLQNSVSNLFSQTKTPLGSKSTTTVIKKESKLVKKWRPRTTLSFFKRSSTQMKTTLRIASVSFIIFPLSFLYSFLVTLSLTMILFCICYQLSFQ